jgi:probable HAF family extracellular repeat protein
VTDLGTLPGADESRAVAINDDGQVVGSSGTAASGLAHAFSWTPDGGMVDIGTPGGATSKPDPDSRSIPSGGR